MSESWCLHTTWLLLMICRVLFWFCLTVCRHINTWLTPNLQRTQWRSWFCFPPGHCSFKRITHSLFVAPPGKFSLSQVLFSISDNVSKSCFLRKWIGKGRNNKFIVKIVTQICAFGKQFNSHQENLKFKENNWFKSWFSL